MFRSKYTFAFFLLDMGSSDDDKIDVSKPEEPIRLLDESDVLDDADPVTGSLSHSPETGKSGIASSEPVSPNTNSIASNLSKIASQATLEEEADKNSPRNSHSSLKPTLPEHWSSLGSENNNLQEIKNFDSNIHQTPSNPSLQYLQKFSSKKFSSGHSHLGLGDISRISKIEETPSFNHFRNNLPAVDQTDRKHDVPTNLHQTHFSQPSFAVSTPLPQLYSSHSRIPTPVQAESQQELHDARTLTAPSQDHTGTSHLQSLSQEPPILSQSHAVSQVHDLRSNPNELYSFSGLGHHTASRISSHLPETPVIQPSQPARRASHSNMSKILAAPSTPLQRSSPQPHPHPLSHSQTINSQTPIGTNSNPNNSHHLDYFNNNVNNTNANDQHETIKAPNQNYSQVSENTSKILDSHAQGMC